MSIREENVREALAVIGPRFDVENFQIGRAEEQSVNCQGADGKAVAVIAQTIELDVVGRGCIAGAVEELGDSGVPIIVAALRLADADLRQLVGGIEGLIVARTEENSGLVAEVLLQEQAQSDRRAALKGNQTRWRAGGR